MLQQREPARWYMSYGDYQFCRVRHIGPGSEPMYYKPEAPFPLWFITPTFLRAARLSDIQQGVTTWIREHPEAPLPYGKQCSITAEGDFFFTTILLDFWFVRLQVPYKLTIPFVFWTYGSEQLLEETIVVWHYGQD